jgi:hypothetical protein
MKLRKHKSNRTFLITFTAISNWVRHVTETHVDETGKARKVVLPASTPPPSPVFRVWATGSCKQSVLRAFLTGRDAGKISTIIREANPLV